MFFTNSSSCVTLNKASYTGYGKFDFVMTINGIIVRDEECNLYYSFDGINHVLSKDNGLSYYNPIQDTDNYGNKLKVLIYNVSNNYHGGRG